jgi:acetyl-CoA C-acetyltransferase
MAAHFLGAAVIRASITRAKLAPNDIETVVMGNVIQAGNKMNPARQAAIGGGVPVDVPAMTVNWFVMGKNDGIDSQRPRTFK